MVVSGRQSGKSLCAIAEIAAWALETPGPAQFFWVTATYKVKDKAWRDLNAHLPKKIIRRSLESQDFIEFKNGTRISIRSADAPESLVGESLHGVVCDEFAQWKSHIWPMHLRPMLGTTGGKALFVGTPRGRNHAYDMWMQGRRGEPGWASFHWTSQDSPYFRVEEWENARRELPERIFRQEYEAEFVEGGGEVFRSVDKCVGPLGEPTGVVIGADVARVRDWTVLVAMNDRRQVVEIQRFQKLDWNFQHLRLIEMATRLKARRVVIDSTGVGDPFVQQIQRAGLSVDPFKFTQDSKANIVENLMLQFERSDITVPNDAVLLDELKAFSFETLPSGRDRYEAPAGRHDDTVMALALAAWGQRNASSGPRRTSLYDGPRGPQKGTWQRSPNGLLPQRRIA